MPREEKFPMEHVEEAKSALRLEETTPEADQCADCAAARKASGDATDLCRVHLAKILGV
jgi:hypothetical protein